MLRDHDRDQRDRMIAATWSVVVGVVILGCKLTAWQLTHSVAVMSDALESVVHVGATLIMFAALKLSEQPPDATHPYGHGKASSFSVGVEGGLVALSGAMVLWAVVQRLFDAQDLTHLEQGMAWTLGAAVVNTALGIYLLRVGRRTRSDILIADGQHVLADVWTSAAALVGVGLVWLTDQMWIDLLVGAVAGLHLLRVGIGLVRGAAADLMDSADGHTVAEVLAAINQIREPEWHDIHRLRVHRVGERRYIDFHLVVPAGWTVERAHDTVDRLEAEILTRLQARGAVTVHLDYPHGDHRAAAVAGRPFTIATATRFNAGDPPVPDPLSAG
jgi:cation diffusion facilitator family transporter